MGIRFHESDVRCMGRDAVGVRGIKLKDGDYLVGGEIVQPDKLLFSVTENGYGKRTGPDEFSAQNRGGQGVKAISARLRPEMWPRWPWWPKTRI